MNQNKAAPLSLPPGTVSWSPAQSRSEGLSRGNGPFSSGCFYWQQLLGTLRCPGRTRGRRETKEGKMGRICVPGKQGALLALGKNQGERTDAIRLKKQNFLCGQTLLCPVYGVRVVIIAKPFVNQILSSHFLCSASRLPCCICTQVPAPNSPRHLFLDCGHVHPASQEPQLSLQCYIKGQVFPL